PAAQPARSRVEKPDARGLRRLLDHRAARLHHLLLLVHRMRRFAAILLASLAASWPAPPAAQHGAKPEINSPFLVNPDVARWRKGFGTDLPEASINLVYTCDTYHHFEHPGETLQSIRRALKPGGRMVVIDFQKIPGETHQQRIDHVRADKETAIKEIEAAGFRFV